MVKVWKMLPCTHVGRNFIATLLKPQALTKEKQPHANMFALFDLSCLTFSFFFFFFPKYVAGMLWGKEKVGDLNH